jgi:hypothetical protein
MRSIRAFLFSARAELAQARDGNKKAHSSASALLGFFLGLLPQEDRERSEQSCNPHELTACPSLIWPLPKSLSFSWPHPKSLSLRLASPKRLCKAGERDLNVRYLECSCNKSGGFSAFSSGFYHITDHEVIHLLG